MAVAVGGIATALAPTVIVIETPANWFNERGIDSKNNGAVQTLYQTVGAIMGVLVRCEGVASIWAIEPTQWKGQAPKEVMMARCRRDCASLVKITTGMPHDTAEAILLGRKATLERMTKSDGTFGLPVPWSCVVAHHDLTDTLLEVREFIA